MARRRPHLTRTVIALLGVVAFWTLAIQVAVWFANRPAVRAALAREIARRASAAIGQRVSIGDLRVELLPPRLFLKDVEVGAPESPFLRARECDVATSQVRLAERELVLSQVNLEGVRINGALPAAVPGERGRPWFRVVVSDLELADVQVERLQLPSGLTLKARDVEMRWVGSTRYPMSAAVGRLGGFELDVPGLKPVTGALEAWARQTGEAWEIRRLRGNGPGWALDAHGEAHPADGSIKAQGTASVDLARLDQVIGIGAGLAGEVEADLEAAVGRDGWHLDADVGGALLRAAGFTVRKLQGELHLSADGLDASLEQATFAGGQVEGSYSLAQLAAPWEHRVALRGDGVSLAGFLHELGVDDAGLAARCRVNADLVWRGERIGSGVGTAMVELQEAAGDVPAAGRVVIALKRDNALTFDTSDTTLAGSAVHWEGRLALGSWVPTWSIQGERVQVPTVARLLLGWVGQPVIPAGLQGTAALDVRLHGPFRDLTVVADVAVAPISFGGVAADGAQASLRVGGGVLEVTDGKVFVGAGHVEFHGTLGYGAGGALQFNLTGKGVPLARMVAWGGVHAPLAGAVDFAGTLRGTLAAPEANAEARMAGVALAGLPFGEGGARFELAEGVVRLEDLRVGPFAAGVRVDLKRQEAVVDASLKGFGLEGISSPLARFVGGALDCTLHGSFPFAHPAGTLTVSSAQGGGGSVELDRDEVKVDLRRPGVWHLSGALVRAAGSFAGRFEYGVDSLRIVAKEVAAGEVAIDGQLTGVADVEVTPPRPPHVEGEIRRLSVEVEGEKASLKEPAHFTVEGSAISLAGATVVGPGSTLFVRGARNADGTLTGNVSGGLPAALLGFFWRGANPRGRVEILGKLSGTDGAPRFEGVAQVRGGSLQLPGLPLPVTDITGVVDFVPEAVRLAGVRFAFGNGGGACEGRIILSPHLDLDLGIKAENVRWPLVAGFAPMLTLDVRVSGPLDRLVLAGDATLQHSVYREQLNLQKLILQQLLGPQRVVTGEEAAIAFNLRVQVPGTLEVNTPMARLTARGELRIVGTSAQPGVLGRLEMMPGGELDFTGVRYELDRGSVTFSNPERIEPFLDLLAHATVQNVEITVGLLGNLDRLTPTFTSNPPLPEMDIVSLLSLGRRADQAGQAQAGAVASSFLTEQLTGAVTRRARSLLAVDQLRVDPFAATTTGNPTARLTVVKQMSADWTVVLATNLASNREEVINSRWRISPAVYLEATRDVDGSYSLEVKWQRRY